MLATAVTDINTLQYPLYASPKLDGIRAVVIDGVVLSRSLKPIPNQHVQRLFGQLNGLDGELIVGDPCSPTVFRDTTSAVMSRDGEPDVRFYVFDCFKNPYLTFMERAVFRVSEKCIIVDQQLINSVDDLEFLEEKWLSEGYEGVMLRKPDSPYKFGRSTLREAYLLKLKRFCDSEAEVIGFIEQMHNANEATRDALGNIERSSCRAGLQGKDTLGALMVRDIKTSIEFDIGTGFNTDTRTDIWLHQGDYIGKMVKYTYFPTGSKEKPRFPVFQGFRELIDM